MQDAGKKTSENAISVEDLQLKSLFNTLFMMFNSRYLGVTLREKVKTHILPKGQIKCTIF